MKPCLATALVIGLLATQAYAEAETFDCGFDQSCIGGSCSEITVGVRFSISEDSILIDEEQMQDYPNGPTYPADVTIVSGDTQVIYSVGDQLVTLSITQSGHAEVTRLVPPETEQLMLGECQAQ